MGQNAATSGPERPAGAVDRLTSTLITMLDRDGQPGRLPAFDAIAAEAGVPVEVARGIFADEQAMLMSVAQIAWMRLVDMVTRAIVRVDPDDPVAQMKAMGEAYLDWAFEDPRLFVIANDRSRLDFMNTPELTRLVRAMRDLLIAMLARAVETGRMEPTASTEVNLLSARSYVYGLARLYADGHFPEWLPDADPRTICKETFRDYIDRVMGFRSGAGTARATVVGDAAAGTGG